MHRVLLEDLLQHPGTTPAELARRFGLSTYRLHRLLRRAADTLTEQSIIQHEDHGIWVVAMDPDCCAGVEWLGAESGGFRQCRRRKELPDGCCSAHSQCESHEMTAFRREVAYRCRSAAISPYHLSELGLSAVQELHSVLHRIEPVTEAEQARKERYLTAFKTAEARLRWKEQRRRVQGEDRIPPELFRRHRQSSGNPFEFSLRKHFALLEVAPEATRAQVLKAWRKLARRFHPDTHGGDEEMMKAINLAKEKIFRLRRWD